MSRAEQDRPAETGAIIADVDLRHDRPPRRVRGGRVHVAPGEILRAGSRMGRVRPGHVDRTAPPGRSGWKPGGVRDQPSQAQADESATKHARSPWRRSRRVAGARRVHATSRATELDRQDRRGDAGRERARPRPRPRRSRPRRPQGQAVDLRAGAGQLTRLEDEIKKCIITAPQDGLVVYYVRAEPLRHRRPAVDHRPGRAGPRGPEADALPT